MEITFEQLPKAFTALFSKVENIERLLSTKVEPQQPINQWFDLTELCNYRPDKPAKATVYGEVNRGVIPVHKRGKKLMFLKSEIDAWLKSGRRKTHSEIQAEADTYLESKKKGGR